MGAFRDHPRIRGEQALWVNSVSVFLGSPPHTRGAETAAPTCQLCAGITPAYAGSRLHKKGRFPRPKDHPRIRGEQSMEIQQKQDSMGSPPHTRGAVGCRYFDSSTVGITPAYAGSSL